MTKIKPKQKVKVAKKAKSWRVRFIEVLCKSANVSQACRAAKITRSYVYRLRTDEEAFKQEWDTAIEEAADALESEARRRAVTGWREPVFYKGEKVGDIRKYSDALLMTLLRAARPDKYRENYRHEHSGPNGTPIPVNIEGLIEKIYGDEWQPGPQVDRSGQVTGGSGNSTDPS